MSSPEYIRVKGIFRAVPGVLVDGQHTELRVDASGALVTTGGGAGGVVLVQYAPPLSFDTGGVLAASGVVRITPGTMLDVNGFNASASTRFFQLFNAVAVPADGAIPVTTIVQVPPMSNFSMSFADGQGRSFSTGIAWCSSTTSTPKTITGVADMFINIQHRNP